MVIDLNSADCQRLDEYVGRVRQSDNVESVLTDLDGALQLIRGLEYIHSKGIVFLGAGPGDVFIRHTSNQVEMKLANLELITTMEERARLLTTIKERERLGALDWELNWMPPEFIALSSSSWCEMHPEFSDHAGNVGFHTDVYIMGCLLFYWFTKGQHPFGEISSRTVFENQLSGNATFLNSRTSLINYSSSNCCWRITEIF